MSAKTSSTAWVVVRETTAWDAIGYEGPVRIKGGRAIYDDVAYNCATARSNRVRLARLGEYHGHRPMGIDQHNRFVEPETVLELLAPDNGLVVPN